MFDTKITKYPFINNQGIYGLEIQVLNNETPNPLLFCAMNPDDSTDTIDLKIKTVVDDYLK